MDFEAGDYLRAVGAYSTTKFLYYDPPARDLSPDSLSYLVTLSQYAIGEYNNQNGTRYAKVKVLKAMTKPAAGVIYYITFEASSTEYDTETFQAKIYDSLHLRSTQAEIKSVRIAQH